MPPTDLRSRSTTPHVRAAQRVRDRKRDTSVGYSTHTTRHVRARHNASEIGRESRKQAML
eukprot:1162808-Rhodomonas_salina.3